MTSTGTLIAMAVAVTTAAVGCANDDDADADVDGDDGALSVESGIIGGRVEKGRPNVVAILVDTQRDGDGSRSGLCSGTLIARDAVLTAAHCLVSSSGSYYYNFRVVFGTEATSSRVIKARWFAVHPSYDAKGGFAYDAAMIGLSDPVDSIRPARYAESFGGELVGSTAIAVGFGFTTPYEPGVERTSGTKMTAVVRVSSLEATHLGVGEPGKTMCHGDSGGPIFARVDGVMKVVGITSWSKSPCTDFAYAQRTDVVAPFIRAVFAEAAATQK